METTDRGTINYMNTISNTRTADNADGGNTAGGGSTAGSVNTAGGDTINRKEQEALRNQAYNEYVEAVTPKHNLWLNMLKAFLTGGTICMIGQVITVAARDSFGLEQDVASTWCSVILILCSIVLTVFNIYPSLATWGGAGALVPITGFANGVCAPAVEFQVEGEVFGKGTRIFQIAGPVILYGIFSSWLLGLIYWILRCFGVL